MSVKCEHEQILPAVVVHVPDPHRDRKFRQSDSGGFTDLGKGRIALIQVQKIPVSRLVVVDQIDVIHSVIIDIQKRRSHRHLAVIHPCEWRDILEHGNLGDPLSPAQHAYQNEADQSARSHGCFLL
jgi:hypothetical protein